MKNNMKIIVFFLIVSGIAHAQFNETEFLYRVKTIYHSLRLTGLDNFSSWITSNVFLEATKEISEEEIYPLEIIWKNPDLLYYIKRPLPNAADSEKQKDIQQLQIDMIQELQGVLVDWQRFSAGNILDEIPEAYLVTAKDDTVFVEYELFENGKNVKTKMFFGKNGLCLKIITNYLHKSEIIYVYPGYILVEDKWLCNKWTVQIYLNGQIDSGIELNLKSRKLEDYWIPQRLVMQLQKREIDNTVFIRDYKFRNVVLNKDLQILR
jgi:hypothetical protein